MSSSNLARKLQPATKAWKSFANKLKSKLQKLKISRLLKNTTHRLKCSLRSIRVLALRKPRAPPTQYHSLGGHHRRRYNHHHHQLLQMNFAAIYVDELFADPASLQMGSTSSPRGSDAAGESKAKAISTADEKGLPMESSSAGSSSFSVADAWKAAVSSLPRVQGIDERAEEFISKFREDMKLQREKSLLDFHDMLARGA